MSDVLVILDRQHSGKPNRVGDTGAWGDLDNDGNHDVDEMEAMLTARYLLEAETVLRSMRYDVFPISSGYYYERHDQAKAVSQGYQKAVYVAAHLNAGGGLYGSVFFDYRSPYGKSLATSIADCLRNDMPELRGDAKVIESRPEGWTSRAYSTIDGVYSGRPVGVCFEPLFLDQPKHYSGLTDDGLKRIGRALADGIDFWVGT